MCGTPLLLFAFLLVLLLRIISYIHSPFCSPPGPGSFLTFPRDRIGRGRGSSVSFSEEKETGNRAAILSLGLFFASPSISSFPSFPSYSPCYLPLPRGWVYCFLFPDELIVVFLCFVRCPRARSAFRPLFRCSVSPFAEGLPHSRPPGPRG